MKRVKAAKWAVQTLYFKVKKDYNHEVVDHVDAFYFLGSLIIKDGRSSVDIRRQMAMAKTKTTSSTLSNIWKARNITRATKIRIMEALVYISNCPLWMWDMDCRKGRQESNISLWDVVLEKAAWDIIQRSHHQWAHTTHYQATIFNYQDWSVQAIILWSCLKKVRRLSWKKNHYSRHL